MYLKRNQISVLLAVFLFAAVVDHSVAGTRWKRQAVPESNITIQIGDIVPLLGARRQVDIVVILDRSNAIGKEAFYLQERRLSQAILTQYATVHPDYARVSVITFAKNSTVIFNHISGGVPMTKCELFGGPDPLWDTVLYDTRPEVLVGTNLKASLGQAIPIFQAGRQQRPQAKQVLIVMTDGDYKEEENPLSVTDTLRNVMNVTIFSVGLGSWLKVAGVQFIATKPEYYGNFLDWQNLLQTRLSSLSPDMESLWVPMNSSYCTTVNCSEESSCFCNVDNGVHDCLCNSGYTKASGSSNCTANQKLRGKEKNSPQEQECHIQTIPLEDRNSIRSSGHQVSLKRCC